MVKGNLAGWRGHALAKDKKEQAVASYIDENLLAGETVVQRAHVSLWSMWHLIAAGIVLLPAFGLGLIFLVMAYVRYQSTELAVTTKRVIVKHGFIRRQTVEINLNKVESVQVDQGGLGRMFNFGTLVVSGTGTSHAPLTGIASPMAFRRAFIEAQDGGKSEA